MLQNELPYSPLEVVSLSGTKLAYSVIFDIARLKKSLNNTPIDILTLNAVIEGIQIIVHWDHCIEKIY